jgi:hypothetical protein
MILMDTDHMQEVKGEIQGRMQEGTGDIQDYSGRAWDVVHSRDRARIPAPRGRMPARNIHHTAVIRALQADGWTITHDPFLIPYGDRRLFIDLGAERVTIGAERGS